MNATQLQPVPQGREPAPPPPSMKYKLPDAVRFKDEVVYSACHHIRIKHPRHEWRGIKDFSLKSLRMWGNKSPHPQFYALNGGELTPLAIKGYCL
jgi:hypothetical protein